MRQLMKRYEDMGEFFSAEKINLKQCIRISTLKSKEKPVLKRLESKGVSCSKVPFLSHGYYCSMKSKDKNFSLGATPEYLQGYYYIQEAASQLPVQVLDPQPGERVLDMAASPGGKTTQISQMMNNEGVIVALESNADRMNSLINNIERMSAANVAVYKKDARYADELGMQFDRVLLDAPCSGNFCVDNKFFEKRTVEDFKQRARLQKAMLTSAVKCLKKKGVLVYSTCSLEPEEDELVIDWLLKNFPEMKLSNTGLSVGDPGITDVFGQELDKSVALTRRFWPHKTGTEGFFIAKLIKE